MTEIWRSAIPGRYEVSDLGRVRSVERNVVGGRHTHRRVPSRILTPDWSGRYARVTVSVDGEHLKLTVHLAVLEAFRGKRPKGAQARHLDGDRKNNRLVNLAWGTPKQNAADKRAHGTQPFGEAVGRGVLNEKKVARIIQLSGRRSLREIAYTVGCGVSTAHHVISGRTWGWFTGRQHEGHRQHGSI